MKKRTKRTLVAFITAVTMVTAAGCADAGDGESLVALNYGTGLAENGEYNTELYGMNGMQDMHGADPGAFYVSEEEDPEWGGYYYMYFTSSKKGSGALSDAKYKQNGIKNLAYSCYRSKTLYNWECCGSESGYSLVVDTEDWCDTNFWAPEVIRNPADGKYYMYFSASANAGMGVDTISDSSNSYDRLYLGVAVSDSPTGPFDIIYDTDTATGKRVPTINFQKGCGLEHAWAAIDVSPFFDEDGTLYLYFNKHTDDNNTEVTGIWGMRMNSMEYPDYSSVVCLARQNKVTASSEPGKITEMTSSGEYWADEGNINEAPFMIKHNGTYYLTYATNGWASNDYSVHQAISDDPLGEFVKLGESEGNPVYHGGRYGYLNGTAHHALVRNGDELWIVSHRHASANGSDRGQGRNIIADRVNFVANADGLDVLTANGPSLALQWLPENVSGYRNLAETAEVRISTGSGVQYLTDSVHPYYPVTEEMTMHAEEDVTITLKWDEPVSISSVMVYNSASVYSAFSKISDMRFKLAEQPEWASRAYDYAVIKDLIFPTEYRDEESDVYIACAPAVAEFDALKITELKITIKEEDRLEEYDEDGKLNTALELSEIVVLGGMKNE